MLRTAWLGALALATFVQFAPAAPAQAQAWPQKPISFIVPFPAGGGTDAFARPLAAQIEAQLGQRVLVDNRAGAGGTVGASAAAKAEPDGYTFFIGAAHHAIAPALYPKLDYDILTDFIPIGIVSQPPQVVVVHPGKVEAKTLMELIEYGRKNPDKLNYGSAGNGTTHHLAGELFKILSKANFRSISPSTGSAPPPPRSPAASCARWRSPPPSATRRSRTCRPRPKPGCRATRSRPGMRCGRRRTRPPRSSSACRTSSRRRWLRR
jgi:tripartite-type tricarboxylate transporter receptor subunit TctC